LTCWSFYLNPHHGILLLLSDTPRVIATTIRLSGPAADVRKTSLVEVIQADNQAKAGLDLDGFDDSLL